MFRGLFLQAFLQSQPPPFAAFSYDFTLDVHQAWQRLECCFHVMTRLAWLMFLPVEEPSVAARPQNFDKALMACEMHFLEMAGACQTFFEQISGAD